MATINIEYKDYNNVELTYAGDTPTTTFTPFTNSDDFDEFFRKFVKRNFDVRLRVGNNVYDLDNFNDSNSMSNRSMLFGNLSIRFRQSGMTYSWGIISAE